MTTNFEFNKPPMTPRFNKRLAPSTPVVTKTTTMVKSHRLRTTPRRRRYHTPTNASIASPLLTTGDRFIPNRARTDVTKAQRAIRLVDENRKSDKTTTDGSDAFAGYQSELRKVLFGTDSNSDSNNDSTPMMSFGRSTSSNGPNVNDVETPFAHDVLRPAPQDSHHSGESSAAAAAAATAATGNRDKIVIGFSNCLDAPGILDHPDLTIISCHEDTMACALGDEIYLMRDKHVEKLDEMIYSPYTCVQFSEDGNHLALGQDGLLQIYHIDKVNGRHHYIAREVMYYEGCVNAIAWNGSKIVAAGEDGVKAIDLMNRNADPVTYGWALEVTTVKWNGNTIATADREHDMIQVFTSAAQTTADNVEARFTFYHEGVRCLECSPRYPNLLASGGKDSVKFWNINNGKCRGEIKTDSTVAGILFSKTHNEIVIADQSKLFVYSLSPKVIKLAEHVMGDGKRISSMTAGTKGNLVCRSRGEDSLLIYSLTRTATGKRKIVFQSNLGTLKMTVVR